MNHRVAPRDIQDWTQGMNQTIDGQETSAQRGATRDFPMQVLAQKTKR